MLAALRRGRFLDRLLVTISVLLHEHAGVRARAVRALLPRLQSRLFPLFGPGDWVLDRLHHLALPAIVLGLHGMGFMMRLHARRDARAVRAGLHRVCAGPRAQQLPRHGSLRVPQRDDPRHDRGRAALTGLLTGSVLVETVFGLPGLGTLLVNSVIGGDFPMIQGLLLFIAAWIILSTS